MKPKISRLLFTAPIFLSLLSHATAADVTKLDNLDNLNLGTSWALGTAPGTGDVAVWDASVTGASSTLLGSNLSWKGIKIQNPAGSVALAAGNTLTLGASGIDMSAATQDLTIASGLSLLANTSQSWQVASGRALNVSGALAGGNGGAVHFVNSGGGIINISSGTPSSRLSFATLNGLDVAALDASKNVVAATSVFTYTNPNGGNASGTLVGINVQSTTTGATQAYRHSNTLTVTNGIRFNAANTQNTSWTVDTSTAGRVGTIPHIIVTANVGAQDVIYNGNGGIRAATSGGELFLHQLNSAGRLIFNVGIFGNGTTSSLTKTGAGTVVAASASSYGGVTRINEGSFQLGNAGTVGSLASTSIINHGNLSFNRTDTLSAAYNISGTGSVTQAGSGSLSLTGTNSYSGATNFNAGSVSFNALANFGSGSELVFNGGELSWNGITSDISTRTVTLGAGGGKINTNGNNVAFANSIGNGGAGGLTKNGLGVLTLNGGSYTGTTTISGGSLVANGAMAGGAAVNDGATLGGTATYAGTIAVNNGGIIAPGNSVGTITTNALTLGIGSILNFEFNDSPANDFIDVTGSNGLTLNGGGFNLYLEGGTSAFSAVGDYNLIGYTGSIGGTGTSALSVLNPQPGKDYTFGSSASNVTLNIAAAGFISNWNADSSGSWGSAGNWSAGVPNEVGAAANLTLALSAPATLTLDGSKTVGGISFDSAQAYTVAAGSGGALILDNGASQANVIGTSGNHTISSDLTLTSSTVAAIGNDASITLSGDLNGSANLTKSGNGTLDLTNSANSLSGELVIAGGTLGFSASGSLGSGAITLDGGTLRYNTGNTDDISAKTLTLASGGGTLDTQGNDVTLANAIGNDGSGALTKTGAGTLTLSGSNTYTGGSVINSGVISINTTASLGAVAGNLSINAGTLKTTANISTARNIAIQHASSGILVDSGTYAVSGVISGSGTLNKTGAGTLSLSGSNSFSGAYTVGEGTLSFTSTNATGSNVINIGNAAVSLTSTSGDSVGSLNFTEGTGSFSASNSISNYLTTGVIQAAAGATGNVSIAGRATLGGASGSGTLNLAVGNVNGQSDSRYDLGGSWTAFTGTVNFNATTASSGARLFMNGGSFNGDLSNAIVNISGTGANSMAVAGRFFTNGTINIGALSGDAGAILQTASASGAGTYAIGAKGLNTTYAGVIQNGASALSINKVGSAGTLTLTGDSTYTGATTVSAGTLLVNGSLGNTAVSVNNGGKLGGSDGVIGLVAASVTVNSGGTLAPGNSAGTLTVNGSTTLNSNSTYAFEYTGGGSAADLLDVNGTLNINEGALLSLTDLGTFSMGDKFTLFAYESLLGSFTAYADGQAYSINGGDWLFNYNDSNAGLNGGTVSGAEGSGFITITAVPEPSAALLVGGLGVLSLLRRRRSA